MLLIERSLSLIYNLEDELKPLRNCLKYLLYRIFRRPVIFSYARHSGDYFDSMSCWLSCKKLLFLKSLPLVEHLDPPYSVNSHAMQIHLLIFDLTFDNPARKHNLSMNLFSLTAIQHSFVSLVYNIL